MRVTHTKRVREAHTQRENKESKRSTHTKRDSTHRESKRSVYTKRSKEREAQYTQRQRESIM